MTRPAAFLMQAAHPCTGAPADALPTHDGDRQQRLEDAHLIERVERALRATGYGPLRRVAVSIRARLIVLAGRVPTYYLKQIAQATVLSVPGVDYVCNNLEVGQSR